MFKRKRERELVRLHDSFYGIFKIKSNIRLFN